MVPSHYGAIFLLMFWFLALTLGRTQSISLDDMLILGEFLSGPRVVGTLPREGGDFPGCKIQLSSGRACLSVSVKSGGRTAARSQRVTRGLRTTEKPPLCRVRTAHVAGCMAPTLFHYPSQQLCRKPQSFILLFFSCSHSFSSCSLLPFLALLLSQKRVSTMLLEDWSGFFSTPVDSAHVDNIHRMSVN